MRLLISSWLRTCQPIILVHPVQWRSRAAAERFLDGAWQPLPFVTDVTWVLVMFTDKMALFLHSSRERYLSAALNPHYPGEMCFKV